MKFLELYEQLINEATFAWKQQGTRGSYKVRFRFANEQSGEKFFDSEYAVYDAKLGYFEVVWKMDGDRTFFKGTALSDNLDQYLKPGTTVTIYPTWIKPGGTKSLPATEITIKNVKKVGDNSIGITYT